MIRVVHPGSRIRILTFYLSRILDPGSKRHRIPDPDPQHCLSESTVLIEDQDVGTGIALIFQKSPKSPCMATAECFLHSQSAVAGEPKMPIPSSTPRRFHSSPSVLGQGGRIKSLRHEIGLISKQHPPRSPQM